MALAAKELSVLVKYSSQGGKQCADEMTLLGQRIKMAETELAKYMRTGTATDAGTMRRIQTIREAKTAYDQLGTAIGGATTATERHGIAQENLTVIGKRQLLNWIGLTAALAGSVKLFGEMIDLSSKYEVLHTKIADRQDTLIYKQLYMKALWEETLRVAGEEGFLGVLKHIYDFVSKVLIPTFLTLPVALEEAIGRAMIAIGKLQNSSIFGKAIGAGNKTQEVGQGLLADALRTQSYFFNEELPAMMKTASDNADIAYKEYLKKLEGNVKKHKEILGAFGGAGNIETGGGRVGGRWFGPEVKTEDYFDIEIMKQAKMVKASKQNMDAMMKQAEIIANYVTGMAGVVAGAMTGMFKSFHDFLSAMSNAIADAIRSIIAQILKLLAIYAILEIITGGTAGPFMKFMKLGMGLGGGGGGGGNNPGMGMYGGGGGGMSVNFNAPVFGMHDFNQAVRKAVNQRTF